MERTELTAGGGAGAAAGEGETILDSVVAVVLRRFLTTASMEAETSL